MWDEVRKTTTAEFEAFACRRDDLEPIPASLTSSRVRDKVIHLPHSKRFYNATVDKYKYCGMIRKNQFPWEAIIHV